MKRHSYFVWHACMVLGLCGWLSMLPPRIATGQSLEDRADSPRRPEVVNRNQTSPRDEPSEATLEDLYEREEQFEQRADKIDKILAEQSDAEKSSEWQAELEAIRRKADEVRQQIHAIEESRDGEPIPRKLTRQVEHLYVAAENLRAAGMDEEAEALLAEADQIVDDYQQQLRQDYEYRDRERQWEELEEEIMLLREEVERLGEQVEATQEFLQDLVGLIEDGDEEAEDDQEDDQEDDGRE